MADGDYGEPGWYRERLSNFDRVICADGGSRQAIRLGLVPDWVIGDMDSISQSDHDRLEQAGVEFRVFPAAKDFTDTHLALEMAAAEGAGSATIWGGAGSRLDHTLANLYSAWMYTVKGISIRFESPGLTIYLVKDRLLLHGREGDTVSVLTMGDRAEGVQLRGFRYPLRKAVLNGYPPVGVSNTITRPTSLIQVASGVLAVFHYQDAAP
jgi:thiamine pyrophosphokinase